MKRLLAAFIVVVAGLVAPALGHELTPLPVLDFEPPAPGTYTLHRIMTVPDGEVLSLDARVHPFREFTRDRITLLGLIYTTCVDPEGCPLAARVFDAVRESVAETPELRGKVRLVSLSFDPERDTHAAMRGYAGHRATDASVGVPWHFLTTRGPRALRPLVDGLGQDVRRATSVASGHGHRELSHVLKVFLIDRAGFVREIYSSTFLHPRTVLNDIVTLLMED